jgi:3-deoxy-D-manno-octulosonate 8-phosphate phosphatase (KDO 8-P phosphatase)
MVTLVSKLDEEALRLRARRIRLVLTDCDGVLTDAGVYYSADGEELRKFSVRDGMGFELLRGEGIVCGIVSGEPAGSIAARAQKLRLEEVHLGIREKGKKLEEILASRKADPSECAYIGDDVNDLVVFRALDGGLTACPSDALPPVKALAHVVLPVPGGHHVFRAFADFLLSQRS